MSPESQRLLRLAAEVRREIGQLDRLIDEATQIAPASPDLLITRAGGSVLHDFSTGIERIFLRIARDMDGGAPSGSGWHSELLRQMTLDIPRGRPAVLDSGSLEEVDEYLQFRHVFRNLYGFRLDWSRIHPLLNNMPAVWQKIRTRLEAFATFLENLSAGLDI